ncbi:hypothetical protein HBI56_020300 [Parastagonospora nodorum]|uniref:Uncharacterized protein n=1 Tax=Phaeosphaeria nodorum (strain SN15 / ATCC MYA-4574 / FGSC 10173) TaxID=321614 RepID=A0A7U2HYC5_PHANO|nr:hypothetical protein HBH56_173270 [Parastagonospora nodorum]QRC96435.1 hypothetical protein JI435_433650 [Parastagonospora nodorum SN15]KAH3926313.1 hypothetical protein HBH54_169840 [Parastagonospora nodorum]KAH3955575.1 hypothetical protein HBH53_002460 [Parastagonospora nodorum]KAH3971448.1 hypothetical protein HBH51_112020 [Parastagonospora nodorum]
MDGVKGKVVFVTGASSGIGLATVQTLNRYGAKILACDIAEAPESVLSLQECKFVRVNLADAGAAEKVVEDAVAAFGRIDGLINVAGVMDTNNSVDTLTDALWDRVIAINLTAPVKLMRAVVPHMIKTGGGSIVNVASKAATCGAIAGVAYTASKHGIVGATKNVAFRFRGDRIRCNAICPGGVNTSILSSIDQTKVDMGAMKFMQPVHDLGVVNGIGLADPQKHANVLAFLISDLSSEISGSIIPVDHGWSTL